MLIGIFRSLKYLRDLKIYKSDKLLGSSAKSASVAWM